MEQLVYSVHTVADLFEENLCFGSKVHNLYHHDPNTHTSNINWVDVHI